MGCGSRGASNMPLGSGIGWRRSRFSARIGEETVTLMARRMDADSLLLCRFELSKWTMYGKANN
jgi:hypothetical protein